MAEASATMDTLFPNGQIRLQALSVYNWGSFCGLHSAIIDPFGTLITGDNGAGKSTLIDGLIALLLPSGKATFNVAAAQGDKADRSIISYVRGSYGSEHDGLRTRIQSKRNGAVVSALRAAYVGDDGACFTLASLLWIPTVSSALADLKRLHFVCRRDLTLEELLEAFDRGQARAVKQQYRGDDLVKVFENFAEYQECYKRVLYIQNENAPALLARALGLKKIDDLTTLIRDFVLEPSTVRDAARKAVAEFGDLVATHNELLDARQQQTALAPLPALHQELVEVEAERRNLDADQRALPVYFAIQAQCLWQARAQAIGEEISGIERSKTQLARAEEDGKNQQDARHADYLQAGGSRLEDLKKERDQAKLQVEKVAVAAAKYQKLARSLQLDDKLQEAAFLVNLQRGRLAQNDFERRRQNAQDRFGDTAAAYSAGNDRLKELRNELAEVESRPNSAIPPLYQKRRDELADALEVKQEDLLFIGELLDVKETERAWQGAIERALGGLRTTLAVPENLYPLVTRWVNARHLGIFFRAQVIRDGKVQARFKEQGYLRKLEWREHPYREWLKYHLSRFDLSCVADTQTLDATPQSMTQSGLIHRDQGRFEKQDQSRVDDRHEWSLGFSNARRLALLKLQVQEQETAVRQALDASKDARQALNATDEELRLWLDLLALSWDGIDLPRARHLLAEAERSVAALEASGGGLAQALKRWQAARDHLDGLQLQLREKEQQLGAAKDRLQNTETRLRQAETIARIGLDAVVAQRLTGRVGDIADAQLDRIVELEGERRSDIEGALGKVQRRHSAASHSAIGTMSAYRSRVEWQALTAEWGSNLSDLPVYLERLEHIEREGLPKLVEQFQERLNRHTTHSLAGIRSQITNELDDIRDRINTINLVLARTEFRQGTHLRLKAESDEYEHVRDFNRLLQGVMQSSTSDDHEARFAGLKAVVAILEKAVSPASAYTKESQRLLDPRYRLSFVAEEIVSASGQIRDVLASSSGKSGGEKEAFAGTIVAASLAYVLTPNGATKPIYCTVFLDEAFSNTAEAVSRRVLRVFRELHIHINLITPFKNLNLARESARSLLIAERDQERHESRLCQVAWEEIDRQLSERAGSRLPDATALAGVSFERTSS